MNRNVFFCLIFGLLFTQISLHAQLPDEDEAVSYETFYDDPSDINKLYLHIQPLYGELFMTNVNIGYGFEVDYYLKDLFDFNINFRKTYGQKFDFLRDVAEKNSQVLNDTRKFYYGEVGVAYHIIDREESSKSKFFLYSDTFKQQNKWETMVPKYIEAPSKLRRIYGIRVGAASYQSTFDVNRTVKDQDVVSLDTLGGLSVYSNIVNHGFYIGGLFKLIRNVTINFDEIYEQVTNDMIFSVYLDLLIFPFTTVDDIYFPGVDNDMMLSSKIIDTNTIGLRSGIHGKFNRDFSFGYNIEMGFRPGIKGQNFYFMGKLSFPLIGLLLRKPNPENNE